MSRRSVVRSSGTIARIRYAEVSTLFREPGLFGDGSPCHAGHRLSSHLNAYPRDDRAITRETTSHGPTGILTCPQGDPQSRFPRSGVIWPSAGLLGAAGGLRWA
jgi:hypothetical protein